MLDILVQIIVGLLAVVTAVVKSVHFAPSQMTDFELERRVRAANDHAGIEGRLRREWPLHHALWRIAAVLLQAAGIALLLAVYSPLPAVLFAVAWWLVSEMLAANSRVANQAEELVIKYRARLFAIVDTLRPVLRFFTDRRQAARPLRTLFYSKQELLRAINAPDAPLAKQDKLFIRQALSYGDKLVKDVMTPRAEVTMISQDDTVGPVLLDQLHKSNHPWFLVAGDDPDQVAGILYAHDVIPLDPKAKQVSDLMNPNVIYLEQDKSLDRALRAFLQTKQHLFIVINKSQGITGVISIEDIIEQIIGRKLAGEFSDASAIAAEPVKR